MFVQAWGQVPLLTDPPAFASQVLRVLSYNHHAQPEYGLVFIYKHWIM